MGWSLGVSESRRVLHICLPIDAGDGGGLKRGESSIVVTKFDRPSRSIYSELSWLHTWDNPLNDQRHNKDQHHEVVLLDPTKI